MVSCAILVLTVATIASVVHAEVGECRFDSDECSCKMGEENQGVCWDQIPEDPLNCKPRACNRGWTCACGGRTHVCKVGQILAEHNTGAAVGIGAITGAQTTPVQDFNSQQAFAVRQQASLIRPCSPSSKAAATKTDLTLGTIGFAFSTPGTLANK